MSDIRLHGTALWAARLVTIIVVVTGLGLFYITIPYRMIELVRVSLQAEATLRLLPLPADRMDPLLATVPRAYPIYALIIELTLMVLLTVIAVIIFWKRSDDWVALLLVAGLVTYGLYAVPAVDAWMAALPQWAAIGNFYQVMGITCALMFFYLFPDGLFVPRWTRLLALIWGVWAMLWVLFPSSGFNFGEPFGISNLYYIALMFWWASGLYAQIYRFRRVSNAVERQQTKWIVYGVAFAVFVYGLYVPVRNLLWYQNPFSEAALIFQLTGVQLFLICVFAVPLSFGISILRYRLWDIDIIIHRTLVYGALTLTLAVVYFSSVVLLQALFVAISGQRSAIAVVISTLVIAALFTPLRRRIQNDIDRHFFRRKYDAEKTLERFAAGLRQEVDLDDLQERIVAVVQETLQPESVNLWLPKTAPRTGETNR